MIQTLDEVVRIQDEGRSKRRAAEQEIGRLEGELKQKLLDIHTCRPVRAWDEPGTGDLFSGNRKKGTRL